MRADSHPQQPSSSVWAIILAAGRSSRFGSRGPKQLVPFAGEPLVAHMTRTALSSRAAEVIVVTGYRALEVAQAVTRLGVHVVTNERFAEGQGTSVAAGVQAVGVRAMGAIFIPCDQPYLTRELIDQLIAQFEATEPALVVPAINGIRRAPVVVGRGLFGDLEELEGDQGARQIFPRYEDRLVELPWTDLRALADFDTQQEFERLLTWGAETDAPGVEASEDVPPAAVASAPAVPPPEVQVSEVPAPEPPAPEAPASGGEASPGSPPVGPKNGESDE